MEARDTCGHSRVFPARRAGIDTALRCRARRHTSETHRRKSRWWALWDSKPRTDGVTVRHGVSGLVSRTPLECPRVHRHWRHRHVSSSGVLWGRVENGPTCPQPGRSSEAPLMRPHRHVAEGPRAEPIVAVELLCQPAPSVSVVLGMSLPRADRSPLESSQLPVWASNAHPLSRGVAFVSRSSRCAGRREP